MPLKQSIESATAPGFPAALARTEAALDELRSRHADGSLPLLHLPNKRDDISPILGYARLLREKGGADKLLIVGGVIPEEDQALLGEAGVARFFTMGADTREIVAYLNDWRAARDSGQSS